MIGRLPTTVNINGIEYPIRTDYRDILRIFEAYTDEELSAQEKWNVALMIFYEKIPDDANEAAKQFACFVNRGEVETENNVAKPLYDWKQDEQIIFQAVNKTAGKEIREVEYMHWWTFLGLFSEIGECLFSSIVNIRNKKNKGKSLEKHEREFYNANKKLVDIKKKYSPEQLAEMEKIKKTLGLI